MASGSILAAIIDKGFWIIQNFFIMKYLYFFLVFFVMGSSLMGKMRTWQLEEGPTFKATFYVELGGMAFWGGKGNSLYRIELNKLIQADQDYIAQEMEKKGTCVDWDDSKSKLKTVFGNGLFKVVDGEKVAFSFKGKKEPDIYVIYCGASWCGPCNRFVPFLKRWYDDIKSNGVDNVEVIFVSSDHDGEAQLEYMVDHEMNWPAVNWHHNYKRLIQRYERGSIPGLVVIDRDGHILYDAHSGKSDYIGPSAVFKNLKELVIKTNLDNAYGIRALFPEVLFRYVSQNEGNTIKPEIVYAHISENDKASLSGFDYKLKITIEDSGRVGMVKVVEGGSDAQRELLETAVKQWLFLPQLENGIIQEKVVLLPLSL